MSRPIILIDTGVATDKAFEALESALHAHGVGVGDVGRIILTHKHIDHIGNAWRIQRQSGAEILIHESERQAVSEVDPGGRRFRQLMIQRLREWNTPEAEQPDDASSSMPEWILEPAEAQGLVDGQRVELAEGELEVVHTPGHTLGSICLRYGPYLFSGDHVLPDISPNVGGGDLRQAGLLGRFLASLQRVEDLDDTLQVMPGHGEPFDTLKQRCRQLREHHQDRLEQILAVLRQGPRTVYQVASELFGRMDDLHVVLGCAEANAHLELLEERNQVRVKDGEFHLA